MEQNRPVTPPVFPPQTPYAPPQTPYAPPQAPYAPPPVYSYPVSQPKPRIRRPSDRRDLIAAGTLTVLAIFTVNSALYGGLSLGYVLGYLALLLCGALYLRPALGKVTPYALFCCVAAVAMGGVFLWHNDPTLKTLGVPAVSILLALTLMEVSGTAREDGGTLAILRDVWRILISHPLHWAGTAISSIFLTQKGETIEKRRCGGALLGLLCAFPVLLVVVPLLIHADAAFEGLLRHTVLDNLSEAVASLIMGLPLFCLLFSRLFGVRHALSAAPANPTAPFKGVGAVPINTFLATVSGVYVVYLFSQLAYFFSAFSGILPEDYKAAEYARRGFFEMCAVCAINLVLVAVTLWLSRKTDGKAPLSTRLLGLFMLVFSLGMVATALSKMGLYIHSFGMTRLRLLTGVFMLMLAAVLVFVVVRLFATRFPYMKAAVVTVALLGLAVGYADVDTVIARYNITAYREGVLEEDLDLYTLGELSDGAVPYLVELWDERTPENEKQLTRILSRRLSDYGEWEQDGEVSRFVPYATDFRKYNVDVARARALLIQRAEEIRQCEEDINDPYRGNYEEIW